MNTKAVQILHAVACVIHQVNAGIHQNLVGGVRPALRLFRLPGQNVLRGFLERIGLRRLADPVCEHTEEDIWRLLAVGTRLLGGLLRVVNLIFDVPVAALFLKLLRRDLLFAQRHQHDDRLVVLAADLLVAVHAMEHHQMLHPAPAGDAVGLLQLLGLEKLLCGIMKHIVALRMIFQGVELRLEALLRVAVALLPHLFRLGLCRGVLLDADIRVIGGVAEARRLEIGVILPLIFIDLVQRLPQILRVRAVGEHLFRDLRGGLFQCIRDGHGLRVFQCQIIEPYLKRFVRSALS